MSTERGKGEGLETTVAPTAAAKEDPIYLLQVVEGTDRGKTVILDGQALDRAHAGKSTLCELQLSDALVSRRHVSFTREQGTLRLLDLDSTNGVFVNDTRVGEAWLRGGETVRLGATLVRVTRAGAAASSPQEEADRFGAVLGASDEMRRLYPLFARLATSHLPVVIEGEVGTGKELVAEALHLAGPRANNPFLVFDCACTPTSAVEDVLFGEGGRAGLLEQAGAGTLLIDELAELDMGLQARLLRVIEGGEHHRKDGTVVKTEARIITSSRRDLDREVQAGRLREDLFYRLAVARVELPALRRRHGDVPLLLGHFWRVLGGAGGEPPADLVASFSGYDWPGNVRELENAVARRIALGEELVQAAHPSLWPRERATGEEGSAATATAPALKDFIDTVIGDDVPLSRARFEVTSELERRFVRHVLAKHGGNVTRAAAASGLALRYFQVLKARTLK